MKTIRPGQIVYWRENPGLIVELKGFSEAIFRTLDDTETEIVRISDLTMSPANDSKLNHNLIKDKKWDKAVERYRCIEPLLRMKNRQEEDVKAVADAENKSIPTIYRWLKRFDEAGIVTSLLRSPRSDKGGNRVSEEVEAIINKKINDFYLVKEGVSIEDLKDEIYNECRELDLDCPHKSTIYRRVRGIDQRKYLSKRYSPKFAREKLEPLRGHFPGATYPNSVVQIDHTPMDIIIVDDEHRLPIGKPFLTIAIDVTTKMISGFCMTLDDPCAMSAGLCIAHSVMQKELWLAKRDIDAEWPIYGKMQKIHLDNAKEFRGTMMDRACEQYGIIKEFRPKGMPNYGGAVERAFGTFMQKCHKLSGTTFSSVAQKREYNSEGKAIFTLSELDLWFTYFIVYSYHHKGHRGISNIPPIKLYHKLVHGTEEQPGVGLPAPIEDEETLRLDFTPYKMRTVQKDGVVLDNIKYYAPILRRWILAKDPDDFKKIRKFHFARDPRDISVIYFLDPETHKYSPIPYFNTARPAISLWELKEVMRKIKEDPLNQIDEDMIFRGINKMREVEEIAIEKTRLAKQGRASEKRKRRNKQRRKNSLNVHTVPQIKDVPQHVIEDEDDDFEIKPFDDIKFD